MNEQGRAGRRVALLVATSEYDDARLRALRAPMHEVRELRDVLQARGDFDEVETVVNGTKSAIERKIAWLFVNRGPEDLVLLYVSCHGRQNDHGWLSFAVKDTELDAPEATSIEAAYVQRRISESQASAKVVLLDCCFSGAFSAGWVRKSAGPVSLRDQLAGRGTYIMTASNEFEYAFEGDIQIRDRPVFGSPFTQAILEGIRSGGADRDGDGLITGDELYQYVHDEVMRHGRQTPTREAQFEGDFVIAAAPPSLESAQNDQAPSDDRPEEHQGQTGNRWKVIAPVSLLVLVILGQLAVNLVPNDDRISCVDGRLTLVGSTIHSPLLHQAADVYQSNCPGSSFDIAAQGTLKGFQQLTAAGEALNEDRVADPHRALSPEVLALADGLPAEENPQLQQRSITVSIFTLVGNRESGVQDLTRQQISDIYAGKIVNWAQLGGNDLPIRLVSRTVDSSTRRTFEQQVLNSREPGLNSQDCVQADPGSTPGVVRCERDSAARLLETVADTPGALGYSELDAAANRADLALVGIDGLLAASDMPALKSYPFWERGLAYTYGHPMPDSLAASFLDFLSQEARNLS